MDLINSIIGCLSRELAVLLTATLPIVELRGAIPVGISLGMDPLHATFVSFIGSLLPVPLLLIGIRPVFNYMKNTSLLKGIVEKLTAKSFDKSIRIQKHGFWGLVLFVAIPLPGTGVWSGTLAAALLDMRLKLAFPAIFIGNTIAAILVMKLSNGVMNIIG